MTHSLFNTFLQKYRDAIHDDVQLMRPSSKIVLGGYPFLPVGFERLGQRLLSLSKRGASNLFDVTVSSVLLLSLRDNPPYRNAAMDAPDSMSIVSFRTKTDHGAGFVSGDQFAGQFFANKRLTFSEYILLSISVLFQR